MAALRDPQPGLDDIYEVPIQVRTVARGNIRLIKRHHRGVVRDHPPGMLQVYLVLEHMPLLFDDHPIADQLRDVMDTVWYALTDADRRRLNRRRQLYAKRPRLRPTGRLPAK